MKEFFAYANWFAILGLAAIGMYANWDEGGVDGFICFAIFCFMLAVPLLVLAEHCRRRHYVLGCRQHRLKQRQLRP